MKKIYYGWLIVLVCMLNNTFGIGIFPVMGLFTAPLVNRYSYSASSVGLTLSMLSVGTFAGYYIFGKLLNSRNNKLALLLCCSLQAASFIIMGFTELRYLIIAYPLCFLIGFCGACTIISTPTIINNWFVSNNGLALGITGAGTGLSALILAPVCSYFIYSTAGIRGGYYALATGNLLTLILFVFFLEIEPERKGLKTQGERKSVVAVKQGKYYEDVRNTRNFRLLIVVRTILSLTYTLCFVQVATHIINVGYPPAFSALIVSLYGASLIAGKVAVGFLSDRIKLPVINLICYTCLALSTLSAVFIEYSMALGYFYVLFSGLGLPLLTVVYPVMLKDMYGNQDFPKMYAMSIQASPLALAGGSYIAGLAYDLSGSYASAFCFSAAITIAAYFMVRSAYNREKKAELNINQSII